MPLLYSRHGSLLKNFHACRRHFCSHPINWFRSKSWGSLPSFVPQDNFIFEFHLNWKIKKMLEHYDLFSRERFKEIAGCQLVPRLTRWWKINWVGRQVTRSGPGRGSLTSGLGTPTSCQNTFGLTKAQRCLSCFRSWSSLKATTTVLVCGQTKLKSHIGNWVSENYGWNSSF